MTPLAPGLDSGVEVNLLDLGALIARNNPAGHAAGPAENIPCDTSFTRYSVPATQSAEERFEHWRTWFGSAVVAPTRLEKTAPVRAGFNPSATSLDRPGFSLVELNNEPAHVFWERDTDSQDLRLVHFRGPTLQLNFCGRSETVRPGTVRFLDLSSAGSFLAPAGMITSHINIDRAQLGLNSKSMKRLRDISDLRDNPLVRGLVIPALSNWNREGMGQEAGRLGPVFRSMMAALTGSLLEAQADNCDVKLARLANIKNHIRRNSHDPEFDVDAVVNYAYISRRSLYSLFSKEELSVGGYIRAVRTLTAVDLISDTNSRIHSLTKIADMSGFPNIQGLRRAIRDLTGSSLTDAFQDPDLLQAKAAELRAATLP